MAGWKIELSDDLTQTVPAYRWSQISTVSGHCLHFRSICSSKNCFAYQSSLVKSGKPPVNSCLCPKQGKNMVHSGRMHQRKQQIKPRQNRIYRRLIVALFVVCFLKFSWNVPYLCLITRKMPFRVTLSVPKKEKHPAESYRSGRGQFQRVNFNRASVLPVSVYHKMSCVSIDRTYKVKP